MAACVVALRERADGERRVAMVPDVAKRLAARGVRVVIERGAGEPACFPDEAYPGTEALERSAAIAASDVLLCVGPPGEDVLSGLREGSVVVGQLQPHGETAPIQAMAARRLSSFSLELLPRTTRAQAMDVLSSQAAVAGYEAVLIAAGLAPKFFPMLTTAAGTVRPCKVLVVGAGVAGLQAIATARRLGAQVEGFDVRPETREQIESLGARFLDLGVSAAGAGGYARELTADERARQQEALARQLKGFDVVITTAAVPGRTAPRILSADMVAGMKTGAVIVDIAAETGGNVEGSIAGEAVTTTHGVTLVGTRNLPSRAPVHASEMYARNLFNFLELSLGDSGELQLAWEDDLVAASCLTHEGEIRHAATRERLQAPDPQERT